MARTNLDFLIAVYTTTLIGISLAVLVVLFFKLTKRGINVTLSTRHDNIVIIVILYTCFIFGLTVTPLPYDYDNRQVTRTINVIPIVNTITGLRDPGKRQHRLLSTDTLENVVGNVLMFIPVGFLVPLVNRRWESFKAVAIIGFISSVAIETTQFIGWHFGIYRQVDIDDVIFNTTGALLGYLLYYTCKKYLTKLN